ncbi:cobyrinate a,c-diamide synthase [Nitrincola tibetensis]|uniref:Cobyrinate a,c-diamide synthase n=1 Tax=Nitrincola tibetensis TaxID=2219697 RepID=A0A364NS29_9GAMM|nr:cobyrinate a,c-diamide synthase [Nitrincola tibetensis]RAU19854.1 cobyrinate a,c-diamide synthase [Nitrincola tibetensis]
MHDQLLTLNRPAALITAPGSGQGKSMITAALARLHRNAGRKVRVFKHGPDYLDPMLQELASGQPVYQLHPWMTGEEECRWRLVEAAMDADVILVEGSMGLFDGPPSSADLAKLAGIPALPVIDAWGMAQTFAAVAQGLAQFDPDLPIYDVIANRVGSQRHTDILKSALPSNLRLLGAVPRHEAMSIPDRHLGIIQASELGDLDAQLDKAAQLLKDQGLDQLPKSVTLSGYRPAPLPHYLEGKRIAIARDTAFAFIYRANLDALREMGAELRFFSPLTDTELPDADALWLPGGYPELHAARLAENTQMRDAIKAHHQANKPILAECGGLMYCASQLRDIEGENHSLLNLLDGQALMQPKLQAIGLQYVQTSLGELRGHTYHHSIFDTKRQPVCRARIQAGTEAEPIYRQGSLIASYFHGYFPSAPALVADMFNQQTCF